MRYVQGVCTSWIEIIELEKTESESEEGLMKIGGCCLPEID